MKTIIIDGIEYNLTPKVVFHEGDWIISNDNKSIYQVIEVKRGIYIIRDIEDNHEYHIGIEECERTGRLWTIKDAKDGDVLYAGGSHCYFKEYIFMFSSFTEDNVMSTHFGYDVFHGTFDKDITRFGREEDFMFVTPATKEQRDALFAKMKESGYEWSSEHRKLIKRE